MRQSLAQPMVLGSRFRQPRKRPSHVRRTRELHGRDGAYRSYRIKARDEKGHTRFLRSRTKLGTTTIKRWLTLRGWHLDRATV